MAETKEHILKTSQKLFARFGLNKTTVDEIAKIAHVAKGTIYHYFKSKEEIFIEVIEKEALLLQNEIRSSIEAAQSPQEKLRAFVLTRFRHLKELANYYSALKDEYLSHYSFIDNARKKNFNEEIKMVGEILQEGIKSKIFAIENVNLTALAIVTALKGLEYPWTIETTLQDIEKNIDILLKVLFEGIEAR